MNRLFEWKRWPHPVIPAVPGTWKETYTANADVVEWGDAYYMYYRGTGQGHDRIGALTASRDRFDGEHWEEAVEGPVLDVGAPGSYDDEDLLDPSAAVANGTIYLYYSALGSTGEWIGLATSTDGIRFTKKDQPVMRGRCPEIVYRDGRFYLYYVRDNAVGGYDIHLAISDDGVSFADRKEPALSVGGAEAWDGKTVTTPRIFYDRGLYYMIYAGDDRTKDDPSRFGLATSRDLTTWTKYEGNPIFRVSDDGWDNTALWYGTVERIDGAYWMWYEASNAYDLRGTPYYISAIGLARLDAPYFYVDPESNE